MELTRARSSPGRTRRSTFTQRRHPRLPRRTPMDTDDGRRPDRRGPDAETFRSRPLTARADRATPTWCSPPRPRTAPFILEDHPGVPQGLHARAVRRGRSRSSPGGLRGPRPAPRGRRAPRPPPSPATTSPTPSGRGPEAAPRRPPSRSTSCCASIVPAPGRGPRRTAGMTDVLDRDFFSILAAGFFVGIVVGLTGMGGGALMTPALIFLGVGDAATVVTADLTAAAIYKTGGAIVHAREGSPNLHARQVADRRLGADGAARALPGPLASRRSRGARRRCSSSASASPCCSPRRRTRCGSTSTCAGSAAAARTRDPDPHDPPGPDAARRRPRRPAGRHHQRRLGLGHHDRAADALPRPVRREAGRHRPGPGGAAGAGGRDLQHRHPRPRLGAC